MAVRRSTSTTSAANAIVAGTASVARRTRAIVEQQAHDAGIDVGAVDHQRPHRIVDGRAVDRAVVDTHDVVAAEVRLGRSHRRRQCAVLGIEAGADEILLADVEEPVVVTEADVDHAIDGPVGGRAGTQLIDVESHHLGDVVLADRRTDEGERGRLGHGAAVGDHDQVCRPIARPRAGDRGGRRRWGRGATLVGRTAAVASSAGAGGGTVAEAAPAAVPSQMTARAPTQRAGHRRITPRRLTNTTARPAAPARRRQPRRRAMAMSGKEHPTSTSREQTQRPRNAGPASP